MSENGNGTLDFHLKEVLAGRRRFETAAQSVSRMILEKGVEKITKGGKTIYEFPFFRQGKKHIVGWFEEINAFVNFVQEDPEQAFVLIGEPGNGKTFFVDYICYQYRRFLSRPENRRYTIEFFGLKDLGKYGNIGEIQSQTFEDPFIFAMNSFLTKRRRRNFWMNIVPGRLLLLEMLAATTTATLMTTHLKYRLFQYP